jgi:hypothetical protein
MPRAPRDMLRIPVSKTVVAGPSTRHHSGHPNKLCHHRRCLTRRQRHPAQATRSSPPS